MAELHCVVVTPEKTVRDETAEFVTVTLFDGELGIAPGHSPLIGRLGYGEMRVRQGQNTTRFYIEGGFVEVENNVVSVLTNRAIAADKIDAAAAQQQLETATAQEAKTPERQAAIAQARAQLQVARRA